MVVIDRRDSLHAAVEAYDEVAEVQAQSQSVGCSQLLVERVESELTARLFFVVAQGPDIAGIDKQSTIKFPEERCAQFCIQIQFHVARLVDEINLSVGASETTWSQLAHAPSTYAVGAP